MSHKLQEPYHGNISCILVSEYSVTSHTLTVPGMVIKIKIKSNLGHVMDQVQDVTTISVALQLEKG